jgi:hypothetical protein
VPAQLVKGFPFRFHLGDDDLPVFLKGDGAFVFEPDGGALAFGDERPRQLAPWPADQLANSIR